MPTAELQLSGILQPGETVRVNFAFIPPEGHQRVLVWLGAENTNYQGYGEDYENRLFDLRQSLSSIPAAI